MRDKYEDDYNDDSERHPFEHVTSKIQSEEEVQVLSMDEGLSTASRFLLLMKSSHPLQNYCAINSLPTLLSERDSLEKVITSSEFRYFERRCNDDLQEHFETILLKLVNALEPAELHNWLWPLMLARAERIFSSGKKGFVCPKGSLRAAFSKLPLSAIQGETKKWIEWTCDMRPEAQDLRMIGCEALAACTERSGGQPDSSVMTHCIDLCQDSDYDVRAEICSRWVLAAVKVSDPATVSQQLIPELFELAGDEMPVVQQAAYLCMVNLIPVLPRDTLESRLVPKIQDILKADFGDMNSAACAASLGPLAVNLAAVFSKDGGCTAINRVLAPIRDLFVTLSTDVNDEVRLACAANMPAIVTVFATVQWNTPAANVLTALSTDSTPMVRANVAAGLHHVAAVGLQQGQPLLGAAQEACKLFSKDSSTEVRTAMMIEMSATLTHLFLESNSRVEDSTACFQDLSKVQEHDWRSQQLLFTHANHLLAQHCDNGAHALVHILQPLLFAALLTGAEELVPAACTALAGCVGRMHQILDRKSTCKRLTRELGDSRCCKLRVRFLRFCLAAASQWSSKLLSSSGVLLKVVALVPDDLAVVRLQVPDVLCALRVRLFEDRDAETVDRIMGGLTTLQTDDNPSVARAARVAVAEIGTRCSEVTPRSRRESERVLQAQEAGDPSERFACPTAAEQENGAEARDRAIEEAMQDFINDRNEQKLVPRRPAEKAGKQNPRSPRGSKKAPLRAHRSSLSQLEERSSLAMNKLKALPPIGSKSGAHTARGTRSKPEIPPKTGAPRNRRASNITLSTAATATRSAGSIRSTTKALRTGTPPNRGTVSIAKPNSRVRKLPSLHDNPL